MVQQVIFSVPKRFHGVSQSAVIIILRRHCWHFFVNIKAFFCVTSQSTKHIETNQIAATFRRVNRIQMMFIVFILGFLKTNLKTYQYQLTMVEVVNLNL